jgi:hypothetical protein
LNGAYLSSIVLPCVVSTSAPTQEVMTVDCGGGGGGGGGRQTPPSGLQKIKSQTDT